MAVSHTSRNVFKRFAAFTIRKFPLLSSLNPSSWSTENQKNCVLFQYTGSSWKADILNSLMVLDFKHSLNHVWKLHFTKYLSWRLILFQVHLGFLLGFFLLFCVCQDVCLIEIRKKEKVAFWNVFLWICKQTVEGFWDFGGCLSMLFQSRLLQHSVWNETKCLYFTVLLAIHKQLLILCTFSTSKYLFKVLLGSNTNNLVQRHN